MELIASYFQVFKIKNPDGNYSTGGTRPSFTKSGKNGIIYTQ